MTLDRRPSVCFRLVYRQRLSILIQSKAIVKIPLGFHSAEGSNLIRVQVRPSPTLFLGDISVINEVAAKLGCFRRRNGFAFELLRTEGI